MISTPPILLAGAADYVGARLLQAFEEQHIPVRVLEGPQGPASLKKALSGIHTVFYLPENTEYKPAENVAHACAANKVQKIVYLGGLGAGSAKHSPYLLSRQKVGEIFLASAIPVIEFRTSAILGPGSVAFETIRALVERFPVLLMPRWLETLTQPIAIEDVIAYLLESVYYRGPSRVFEIGGPDQVSYGKLMREYARQRRLQRWMIALPLRAQSLSSRWLSFAAAYDPLKSRMIIETMSHPSVVAHPEALKAFRVRPMDYSEAIAKAIRNEDTSIALGIS